MITMKQVSRKLRHPFEGAFVYLLYFLVKFWNIESCSAFAGFLLRMIGPLTGAHRTGKRNLKAAIPDLSEEKIQTILNGVWDNFGRTIGEYPQLKNINIYQDHRFEVIGAKYIDEMRDDGKPGIIFGAHLASWEVAIMAATQRGLDLAQLYRSINNPYVDRLARSIQSERGNEVLTKGVDDGRKILKLFKEKRHLFLLNDQKLHQGIAVPFFGYPAMTAQAAARLSIKYECPILPVQVERLSGVNFRITFHPPLKIEVTGNLKNDVKSLTCKISESIERWVRKRPEQWLWVHNRWPKEFWNKKNK